MIDKKKILEQIKISNSVEDVENIRISLLGKNGELTSELKELGKLSVDEKKLRGSELNILKTELMEALDNKKSELEIIEMTKRLETDKVDITLNPNEKVKGFIHPLTQVRDEIIQIFGAMGFKMATGPDIEDDFHNFTALNTPPNHPARSMQDTFFVDTGDLLRSQTSSVQIREMEKSGAPIKIITMGRVYRREIDATHTPMFHQLEGLYIDKGITMAYLKGCLIDFLKAFFETDDIPTQFRPHFFPFTEPSAEMDIRCTFENGELKIGSDGNRWLEILGCGMVHPNVLKSVGIDPEVYQGFAFGTGIERITMLKYGLPDARKLFETDTTWFSHYGFAPEDVPSIATGLSKK